MITNKIISKLITKPCLFTIKKGNILLENTNCIINPANKKITNSSGLAYKIAQKAGKSYSHEVSKLIKNIDNLEIGESEITKGYDLKQQFVIHTVAPFWKGGFSKEKELLKKNILSIFEKIHEVNDGFGKGVIKSVVIPAIGRGRNSFPSLDCSDILVGESLRFLRERNRFLEDVRFVLYDDETFLDFKESLEKFL